MAEIVIVGIGLVVVLVDSENMVFLVLFSIEFNLTDALFLGVEHLREFPVAFLLLLQDKVELRLTVVQELAQHNGWTLVGNRSNSTGKGL